jgi:DNA-binding beta-propeller fold protein YncE
VKYGTDLSVIKKWGTFGREEGQLQFPRSVAVDLDGTVYVADWNNRRVQAFTSDGRYLNRFGKLNYDDLQGGFTPEKIGITKAGEIIVQESDDVYVFTRSGRLLTHWRKLNLFRAHTRVAIEPDGYIVGITGKLFSDPVMLRLDTAGNQVAGWGVYGKGRGQLYHPSAVTIDPAGRIYVADWNGSSCRLVVFDRGGTLIDELDFFTGKGKGCAPLAIAADGHGYIYVTQLFEPRLLKLGPFAVR